MNVHENVILDLLPAVRSGQASAESRELVEQHLADNPQLARYAALLPMPDPALEMRALKRTRKELARASWLKALAIFFTLLPMSVYSHRDGFRFMFVEFPAIMSMMVIVAVILWAYLYHSSKQSPALR